MGERAGLLAQAAEIDLAEVDRLNRELVFKTSGGGANLDGLSPAPCTRLPGNGGNAGEWARARATGEDALRTGRVAAFTVAGGPVYMAIALVSGALFIRDSWLVARRTPEVARGDRYAAEKRLFGYSIAYLFALFAAFIAEAVIGGSHTHSLK